LDNVLQHIVSSLVLSVKTLDVLSIAQESSSR
jgi:hypothetical protein